MEFAGQHIISADQFDLESLKKLFSFAHRMRPIAQRDVRCQVLDGYILGNFFFEESTRTRLGGETGFLRLGGGVETITAMRLSSMFKGESFADCIRVLKSFCDIMVVRCKKAGQAAIAAKLSHVPVINAGDGDGEHPTQALLDLFTISEERHAKIDGLHIAMVGDLRLSRTVHSLAKLLSLYRDIRFTFIAPPAAQMPADIVKNLLKKGLQVEQTTDLRNGLKNAHAVYMVRRQKERVKRGKKHPLKNGQYRLTRRIVGEYCQPDVVIMHPLPRNAEIATDVDELKNAAYFRMVNNGIIIRMALFILVLGKEKEFV